MTTLIRRDVAHAVVEAFHPTLPKNLMLEVGSRSLASSRGPRRRM
ncbi:MAG TPA: hypothetical protein PKK74_09975 [Candidatus Methanoculleus thermohydrogenotrophicum]|nr:hypothetical protein [Candidatus Methanoculleus thermohydrogenotrophicum]HOB18996.1 hypothetical protein [Candidatus Methanoculleus thermohydrogenotrophicum]HPZ39030.1 hypothetical protein [Candidatus Methanoculleus thermohydrogenotrophicum]